MQYCVHFLKSVCYRKPIQYPEGQVLAPYISFFYETLHIGKTVSKPSFLKLNGTIKCRGFFVNINRNYSFHDLESFRQLEHTLCTDLLVNSTFEINDYHRNCYNETRTFNNRSYNFIDICNESRECISSYRIGDGIQNCIDKKDNEFMSIACSTNVQRYRLRCSVEEETCLNIVTLGNGEMNCKNRFDELWFGSAKKLSYINCNSWFTNECDDLRRYVETSWTLTNTTKPSVQLRISFRSYCDTFWNLPLKTDENLIECKQWWVCTNEQWQCRNGQCIHPSWLLDGEWDCADASDEEGFLHWLITEENNDDLIESFNNLYKIQPFFMICNLTEEYPCIRANSSNNNSMHDQFCIHLDQIGDGHIDCYGSIDERNTLESCVQSTMLGLQFRCASDNFCLSYKFLCNDECPNNFDDKRWCSFQHSDNCYSSTSFRCWNSSCISKSSRCNRIFDCSFGEDEYMCDYHQLLIKKTIPYREEKQFNMAKIKQNIQLYRFPNHTNITEFNDDYISIDRNEPIVDIPSNIYFSTISYLCNRGVGILMHDNSTVCFCPPQYYGDKCQFHADRILILLTFNLTQSIYENRYEKNLVFKLLILFLIEKQVINYHEVFVHLPNNKQKISTHFIYSRLSDYILHKKQRYMNRSNIINDRPYSIQIEVYESQKNKANILIAIWHYPIYFDYLPVFRLTKILRLTKSNIDINPCSKNPCKVNEQCQQILNDKFKYICLCKNNFEGENCSLVNSLCLNGYCSSNSLCKPDYRALQRGNQYPYCSCPLNRYGRRCEIEHDECSLNHCQNDGICLPNSSPNTIVCICTEQYYGKNCELRKPRVELYINESVNTYGSVVQYFKIDFISLNLILVRQNVFNSSPTLLDYLHNENTISEIILVKLYLSYHDIHPNIYLALLHLNVTSVSGTIQLNERSQCVHVLTLISEYSPIKYHYLCQNQTELICFYDQTYICICNNEHTRVECFNYNHNSELCFHCLSNGRCLKGDNDFLCLCPPCFSGRNCQFNLNSFTFTLDQLFFSDLISTRQKTSTYILFIISSILLIVSLPNNIFSFLTFRRKQCLRNGVGQYLFCMSIINQICIIFLIARLIHLTITISGLQCLPMIDNIFCKIFSYFLTCSIRISSWLTALVTVERVCSIIFLNRQWFKKPKVARYLIGIIFFFGLFFNSYELIFVKSFFTVNNNNSICVIEFPLIHRTTWIIIHQINSIVNSMLPVLINIVCTIIIIRIVLQKKINIRTKHVKTIDNTTTSNQQDELTNQKIEKKPERHARLYLLRHVVNDNKELITRPIISLIPSIISLFSLPLFILSSSIGCQNFETSPLRYLLIVFYLISFIPQIFTFFLYVYPSPMYSNEWQETLIGKLILNMQN